MCCQVYTVSVENIAKKFHNFAEADKADRDFYKNLTGNERLQIQLELLNHDPEERLERVSRIVKFIDWKQTRGRETAGPLQHR
jgi:vacuolar-type H+-ATPase subunit B/Vma2